MIWRETSSKSLCWANCLWVVATHCSRYSNLMQKIFWLYQLIDNVVLNIWNVSENVWRIRVERKKRWPLQLFLLHPPHLPLLPNCHPLSSIVTIVIRCHPEDLITFAAAPPSCPSPPRPTCWSCPGGYWGPPGWLGQKNVLNGKGGGVQICHVQNGRRMAHWRIGTLESPGTQAVVVRPEALSSAQHFSPFQWDFQQDF